MYIVLYVVDGTESSLHHEPLLRNQILRSGGVVLPKDLCVVRTLNHGMCDELALEGVVDVDSARPRAAQRGHSSVGESEVVAALAMGLQELRHGPFPDGSVAQTLVEVGADLLLRTPRDQTDGHLVLPRGDLESRGRYRGRDRDFLLRSAGLLRAVVSAGKVLAAGLTPTTTMGYDRLADGRRLNGLLSLERR